jgi:hypothetical protein
VPVAATGAGTGSTGTSNPIAGMRARVGAAARRPSRRRENSGATSAAEPAANATAATPASTGSTKVPPPRIAME